MDSTQDEKISSFCNITGAAAHEARGLLEASNWNLEQAIQLHFTAGDHDAGDQHTESDMEEDVAGLAPSSGIEKSQGAQKKSTNIQSSSRMKTLKDLQSGGGDGSDDDDDENKQDFFAGGEKSGLAVQNPNRRPTDHFQNIMNQARQNRERPGGTDEEDTSQSNFTGRAQTLGGDDAPSRLLGDSIPPSQSPSITRVTRLLHLWSDGFSVDDGPLHRFDDPANAPTLALINQGRAPLSLLGVQPGQEVDLQVIPHKDEKYVQPKKVYKPFAGSGQRLGSPTPGPSGINTTTMSTVEPPSSTPAEESDSTTQTVNVNDSEPVITLQIRLGDGTRLRSRFNVSHTVGNVYDFVGAANAESRSRSFVLMTTFPSKELADKFVKLGENDDLKRGGVVVQKWT